MSLDATTALQVTQKAISIVDPMIGRLVEMTISAITKTENASGDLEKLRSEAGRQEVQMLMAERQAKVAQEVALARRIETAEEVEMEEYYDVSGSGELGVKGDSENIAVGIGARGQKVSKRIFRFKGHGQAK
jgi:RNA 3'-terminal phosphate cyclase